MTLAAGTCLGPYEILAPIGAGGMGEVYRARDTRLAREVAVKVLPEHLARDAAALSRFEREALAVAALSHPNILDVHDFGHEGGVSFLVTELLEGETLRARLTSHPLHWRTAFEIGLAVADGLAAAHAHGIVHRDLKPENVFLTLDDRVKILDFGLAQLEPPEDLETSPTVPGTTQTGTVMGTAGYMSPEQARGKKADARSDIFSLGCILYEMVTGRRAFTGESAAEVLAGVLREEPRDPGDLVNDLPEQVRLLILRCLSKHPDSRFQSARDLAFALKMGGVNPIEAAGPGRERRRRFHPVFIGAGSAVVAGLLALGFSVWFRGGGAEEPIDSLAVLPFSNADRDPGAEYFSDGITESLINSLSQLPQLRVLARATVFSYRGDVDPRRTGRQLGVRAVLTGRVSRHGDDVVVQAELMDVKDGVQLWGSRFPAKFSDAFAVQEAIAQRIAQSLRLKLTGEQEQRLAKRYTESAEAYDFYLKGRYHWNKRTEEGFVRAIEFFEQSIGRDPNYALPYAGLADTYVLLAFYGSRPPLEVLPKARQNAVRALQIDESLAEAHVTLADTSYLFDWDWEAAEQGFRKAIALNPNYSTAHQWYANYLTVSGRSEEAIEEILRAQSLDPLNLAINTDVGLTYYYAGEHEKAVELYREALEVEAGFFLTHVYLGLVRLQTGHLGQAIEEFERALSLAPGHPDPIALLGHAYGRAGRHRDANGRLEELKELSKKRFISAFPIAFVYMGLGQTDQAFEWLERAYEERAGRLVYLKIERAFDPLRQDPRFQGLLRRLRLPADTPAGSSPAPRR